MKRSTPSNIVIGGAAGCMPVVIAWSAVTGGVDVTALVLFGIIFYWTPPHFWALALKFKDDYAAAGVPMLPVVVGVRETARQIVLYSGLMVAISLVLYPVGRMGTGLPGRRGRQWRCLRARGVAAVAGAPMQVRTRSRCGCSTASITYLTVLFAAMAVDALVHL
jgi:protoheme IX farnesyltransferase